MRKRAIFGILQPKRGSRVNLLFAKGSVRVLLIPFLLVLVVSITPVQAAMQGEMEWNQTYGGVESDQITTVIQTADGGFILVGTTELFEDTDIWLFKTDAKGVKQWEWTYGGELYEYCAAAIQTPDGGFALACTTSSFGAGESDFWLVKTDAAGRGQWSRTYGGVDSERAYDLIQLNDGGFVITGWTQSYGAGGQDAWVVRTDAGGNPLWTQTYGFEEDELFTTVIKTKGGEFAFGGEVIREPFKPSGWFVKTDTLGNVQWTHTYGGATADGISEIIEMPDGSFFLIGFTTSFGNGATDGWLIKTKINGIGEWHIPFGEEKQDKFTTGLQTPDGGLALAGYTTDADSNQDFWLVKVDPSGAVEWAQTYSNDRIDDCYDVTRTKDGGFALAGYTKPSLVAGDSDAWLVKTGTEVTASTTTTGLIIIKPILPTPIIVTFPQTTPTSTTSPLTVEPVTITATDDPLQTPETTPATISETSQAPVTVTVTEKPEETEEPATQINIPGFTTLPVFLGLLILGQFIRKRRT